MEAREKLLKKVRECDMIRFLLKNPDFYNKQQRFGTLQLIDGGIIRVRQGWLHQRRFLERYELLLVTEGRLHLLVDREPVTLEENQVMILSPYRTLQGRQPTEEPVSFYWVDFESSDEGAARAAKGRRTLEAPRTVTRLLDQLCDSLRLEGGPSEVGEALLLLALYHTGREGRQGSGRSTVAQRAAEYIEEHLAHPLTAEEVAGALGYHKDTVCRIMKEATGLPLKEYINRRKMETARTLLRTSSYSVTEIARLLGYEEANLFTKFFSYHEKMTPTHYRKSVR